MLSLRRIALFPLVLGAAISSAQIDGPVPLAWRWSGSTSQSPSGVPAFVGDNIIVGVGGRVYSLDRALGNKKWQYPLLEPVNGNFVSSPIMAEGLILAAATNRTLYAIDPATGELKWSYVAPGAIIGSPVVAGKFIMLNVDGNSIMAVGMDGQAAFENPERVFDGIRGGLTVSGGSHVIYTTGDFELYSLNISTRESARLARLQSLGLNYRPIISGNVLYVTAGSYLIAMNSAGGSRYQRDLRERIEFEPAIGPDTIAVSTETGKLHLFDQNGIARTRTVRDPRGGNRVEPLVVDLKSRPAAAPSIIGNKVVVPTVNGAVNLIDPVSGDLIWSFVIRPITAGLKTSSSSGGNTTSEEILSVPAAGPATLNGESMYILAADGSLLAFDKKLGVDLTGPAIDMLWPQQGLQTGTSSSRGPLEMFFKVSDEASGVNEKTVAVTVGGKPLDFTYGRDGIITVRIGLNEKNKPLADGRAVFEVTATDWMGNKSTATYSLTIDNTLQPIGRPGGRPGEQGGSGGGPPSVGGATGGGGRIGGGRGGK